MTLIEKGAMMKIAKNTRDGIQKLLTMILKGGLT